jgi:PHD/YefM family antitoxin component YafN of YafNO toxin-antitoxin module
MYQVTIDYAKNYLEELCDRITVITEGNDQELHSVKISRGDRNYILMTQEDWEALLETSEWLQTPNIMEDVESARSEYATHETLTMDQMFGS